jgi:hypothetical protein
VASTHAGTLKLVIGLQSTITYRMQCVGRCWTPESRDHYGHRMPALGVTFEEASAVANYLGTSLREFVETARSAGIFIKLSLQRASGNILDTDARAQFAEGECFPVMRDEDALMSLNEETIMAGARPEVWGPRIKDGYAGYFYRECGPFQKHAMPARSWQRAPAALREHIGTWAPQMCWGSGSTGIDSGSIEAMGDVWTDLTSGPDYARSHGWTSEEIHSPDGTSRTLWVPPRELGDVRTERERITVRVSDHPAPVDPTQQTPGPELEPVDDQLEDEMAGRDLDEARAEVEDEIAEELADDPDAEGEDTPDPPAGWEDEDRPEADDIELEAGTLTQDGGSLDWPDKVRAAAGVLDLMTQGQRRTLRTSDMLQRWYAIPGVTQRQRPSLTRILNLLVDHGEGTDEGRGKWTIEPTAGRFLREHIGDLAADDEDDEEDD